MLVQLDDEMHVTVHLLLLACLDLVFLVNEHHLLIVVVVDASLVASSISAVLLDQLIHGRPAFATVLLLHLQHFVKLTLATSQQELAKVHLNVLFVVKLVKERDTEADIDFEVRLFSGALHENDLHELVQQRG